MSVGEAFGVAGEVYVLGIAIALGMAALIKLINYVISRSDRKAANSLPADNERGDAR